MHPSRQVKRHLTVVIAYLVAAIALSWPLALNLSSAIPGVQGDAASFVWAIGWAKAALELGVNPFHSDYVFYPLGGATQLLWAISLLGFASLPLQALFSLVASHNLLYLAATVLTAYGTFLLAEEVLRRGRDAARVPPPDSGPLPPFAALLMTQFILQNRKLAERRSTLAPFTAGLVFAFAPLRLGYGLSFLNLFNTEFVPFYLLCLLRATRTRSLRTAILAGVFLGLNAYIDFQIAAFLILLTVLYALYVLFGQAWSALRFEDTAPGRSSGPHGDDLHLPRTGAGRALVRSLVPLVAVWSMTALTSALVAVPMLVAVANDFAAEGGNYIRVYKLDYSAARSYDLASYLVPNARATLYADTPLKVANINAGAQADDGSPLSPDRQSFAGYTVLVLAAYAVVRRARAARWWLVVAVLFALFSFGPSLHVLGVDTGIPLPFVVLHEIPIINHIRIPMRYGIVVPLALAMLVALAVDALQQRLETWKHEVRKAGLAALRPQTVVGIRLSGLLLTLAPVLVLAEAAVLPYPVQPLQIPRVYEQIASVPGDFTVLEIPTFNWRGAAATEVYQAIHHKYIVRAYTNRIAPGPAEYSALRGIPIVVRSLRALEGADPSPLAPYEVQEDKRVRDQVVRFFNLRFAVVQRSFLKPEEITSIDAYLRDVLGAAPIDDDGQVIAYEIPPAGAAPDDLDIDLNENIGQMYAGRGWTFEYPVANWHGQFNFVWAQGARSEIYFVAGDSEARELTLHAYADSPQRVSVSVNGTAVGQLDLGTTWQDYRIVLPAGASVPGMNRIQLDYGRDLYETIGVTTIQIRRGDHGAQAGR